MEENYRLYRNIKFKAGLLYQDFIVDLCWQTIGLAIVQYVSEEYQKTVGESRTGAEIKFDEKYGETHNLWIETKEKSHPQGGRNGEYVPSGINRGDNSWLYIIGNYDTVYIFQKTILQILSHDHQIRENNTKTSLGFLLKKSEAIIYAGIILNPNARQKISKIANDLSLLGKELHRLIKENPNQMSLF